MRTRIIALGLAIPLIALLSACKKESASQSTGAPGGKGSGQATLLQVKWPVGNRYVYRMDLDQHSKSKIPQMPNGIEQDVTMAMTYALSVLKDSPDGGRELEMEFLANEMDVKVGGQVVMTFDSKETAQNEAQNPFAQVMRKMIGSKVSLQVDSTGKVDKVLNFDEWIASVAGDKNNPAGQMLTQQFNEGFFHQIVGLGHSLSPKPVKVGETWPVKLDVPSGGFGKIAIDLKNTLKGWEDHEQHKCAILEGKGTMSGSSAPGQGANMGGVSNMTLDQGKIYGKSWFDPELGALVDSVGDQNMRIKGQIGAAPGAKGAEPNFTSDINQKVSLKLVEFGKKG